MTPRKKDLVSKPVGPFDTFEECVERFQDDPDVDDPEALCGWMEANPDLAQEYDPEGQDILEFVETLKDPAAETVLTNLTVEYVSGVGEPAQDSQWVYAKDLDDDAADWGVSAPILLHESQTATVDGGGRAPVWDEPDRKQDDEGDEQKAWAPVLIPNETDKQGDVIPAAEIEEAAHTFLSRYRKIDTDHDLFEGKGVPIESWTLKQAQTFALPDGTESREYPAGTWMLGVQFSNEAWERIKEGDLTGFSIYGEADALDVDALLDGDALKGDPREATFETTAVSAELDALEERVVALAKAADTKSTNDQTMGDDNPDDDGPSVEETLKSIQETVEQTKESVESHGDTLEKHDERLDELQNDIDSVREIATEAKELAEEPEASKEDDGEGADPDEEKADDEDDDEDDEDKQDMDQQALAEAVADLLDVPVADVLDKFEDMKSTEGKEEDVDVDELAEKVAKKLDEDVDRRARFEVAKEADHGGSVELTAEDVQEATPQ